MLEKKKVEKKDGMRDNRKVVKKAGWMGERTVDVKDERRAATKAETRVGRWDVQWASLGARMGCWRETEWGPR